MAQGLFNLKQVNQAIQQGGWPNPGSVSTYGAYFGGSGSGQYLTGPTTSALNFSTGSFTVEFWAFLSAYGGGDLTIMFSASNASADFQFGASASNGVYWHNSGNQLTSNATAVPLGKWVHMALVRSGTTASLFCNGVRYSTATNSAAVNLTNFNIGSYQASPTAYMTKGWISNLRITNTAVYDTTATTLTLPLTTLTAISGTQLLTLQNATIIDNSTNALTITNNGSVAMQTVAPFGLSNYKTPAVDYLVVAGGGGGGGYYGSGGGAGGLLQGNVPVTAGSAITVTVGAGGTGASNGYGNNGSSSVFGSISTAGGGGGAGGSTSSTKNGNAGGSGGGGQGFGASAAGLGGAAVSGQGNAGGAGSGSGGGCGGGAGTAGLDSITIVGRGGAGISSAISGTVTAYAGGGAGAGRADSLGGVGGGGNSNVAGTANTGGGGGGDDAKSGGSGIVIISYPDVYAAATAVTGATVSTSGSGSVALSSSAYIRYAGQSAFAFGTGDFTIEGWFYVTSFASGIIAWDFRTAGVNGAYGALELTANGQVQYYANSAYQISSSAGLNTINTWAHIAVTRSGTSTKLFFNGTQVGSTYSDSTNYLVGVSSPYIGSGSTPNAYLPGYISNFRVVKGTAVYTSNFTPPTAPLTAISGTSLLLSSASGAYLADGSTNSFVPAATAGTVAWNSASPFTVTGYKNRVYTWTSSGSITF